MNSVDDHKFIRKCVELSKQSFAKGQGPFGALIVKNGKIVAKSINGAGKDTTLHAEILAMKKAKKKLSSSDLSGCTIYSNCEPCPMCSFMIREFKLSRVVFSLTSPFMGGYSKWKILEDEELSSIKPFFGEAPEVTPGVLEEETIAFFNEIKFPIQKKFN